MPATDSLPGLLCPAENEQYHRVPALPGGWLDRLSRLTKKASVPCPLSSSGGACLRRLPNVLRWPGIGVGCRLDTSRCRSATAAAFWGSSMGRCLSACRWLPSWAHRCSCRPLTVRRQRAIVSSAAVQHATLHAWSVTVKIALAGATCRCLPQIQATCARRRGAHTWTPATPATAPRCRRCGMRTKTPMPPAAGRRCALWSEGRPACMQHVHLH